LAYQISKYNLGWRFSVFVGDFFQYVVINEQRFVRIGPGGTQRRVGGHGDIVFLAEIDEFPLIQVWVNFNL
jgi:hypothetical protein